MTQDLLDEGQFFRVNLAHAYEIEDSDWDPGQRGESKPVLHSRGITWPEGESRFLVVRPKYHAPQACSFAGRWGANWYGGPGRHGFLASHNPYHSMSALLAEFRPQADALDIRPHLEIVKDAVRNYYSEEPNEALAKIGTVMEGLDEAIELAEARARLLARRVKLPKLAPLPEWFEKRRASLSVGDDQMSPAHPIAIATAEKIARATVDLSLDGGEVERAPLGRVRLSLSGAAGMSQVLVYVSAMPWPTMRVLGHRQHQGEFQSAMLYNVFDLRAFLGGSAW